MKVAKASLLQTSPLQDAYPKDTLPATVGPRICVAASIYLGYNGTCLALPSFLANNILIDPVILVAMRSKVLPPQRVNESTYTTMNLDMPLDINNVGPSYEVPLTPEWDLWGEDSVINVCEVRIKMLMKGMFTFTSIWTYCETFTRCFHSAPSTYTLSQPTLDGAQVYRCAPKPHQAVAPTIPCRVLPRLW